MEKGKKNQNEMKKIINVAWHKEKIQRGKMIRIKFPPYLEVLLVENT
jgi:hypothetical protein